MKCLKSAITEHQNLQLAARQGKGVDRHLFGLWCAAYLNGMDIPDIFNDPLYSKSGGGGNFVLSTSTLGFTVNNGFVGPMVSHGYGVFYTITSERSVYSFIFLGILRFPKIFNQFKHYYMDGCFTYFLASGLI